MPCVATGIRAEPYGLPLLRCFIMASGYKLRLGDGTTMLVDDTGMATWLQGGLVDDKARVQPAGSKQWLTIRQLLVAVERANREHQVRQERLTAQRRVAEERAE